MFTYHHHHHLHLRHHIFVGATCGFSFIILDFIGTTVSSWLVLWHTYLVVAPRFWGLARFNLIVLFTCVQLYWHTCSFNMRYEVFLIKSNRSEVGTDFDVTPLCLWNVYLYLNVPRLPTLPHFCNRENNMKKYTMIKTIFQSLYFYFIQFTVRKLIEIFC